MSVIPGMFAHAGSVIKQSWTSANALPTGVSGSAVAGVMENIYILNGRLSPSTSTGQNLFWRYNIVTGLVTVLAQSALDARFGGYAVPSGTDIYFGGGASGRGWSFTSNTGKLARYNTLLNTWTLLATGTYKAGHGSATIVNGRIYIVGGYNYSYPGGLKYDGLHIYDIASNAWTAMPNLQGSNSPFPIYIGSPTWLGSFEGYGPVVGANGNKLMIAAQIPGPGSNALYGVREYDTETQSTIRLAAIPSLLLNVGPWLSGGGTGDGLVVAGGSNFYTSPTSGHAGVYRYNRALDAWSISVPDMPVGVYQAGFTVHNSRLYVFGGFGTNAAGATIAFPSVQTYVL